jgi:hypothetical protein
LLLLLERRELECNKRHALQPNPFLAFLLILLLLDIVTATISSPPITSSSTLTITPSPLIATSLPQTTNPSSQTTIPPPTIAIPSPSIGLPTRAIIGIAASLIFLAVAFTFLYIYRRRRHRMISRRPDPRFHPQPQNGMIEIVEVDSNNLTLELDSGRTHEGPHEMNDDAGSTVSTYYSTTNNRTE